MSDGPHTPAVRGAPETQPAERQGPCALVSAPGARRATGPTPTADAIAAWLGVPVIRIGLDELIAAYPEPTRGGAHRA